MKPRGAHRGEQPRRGRGTFIYLEGEDPAELWERLSRECGPASPAAQVLGVIAAGLAAFATFKTTGRRSSRQPALPADVARACAVLGLPTSRLPSPAALRKARNAAILKAHPDRGGSDAAADRVVQAYRIVAGAIPQS